MLRCSLLLLTVLLSLLCALQQVAAGPALETAVDRAIMYNRQFGSHDEIPYGTRAALLRGGLVRYTAGATRSLKGYTVYVPCKEHLTKSALQQLAGAAYAKGLVLELCDVDTANEEALAFFFTTSATLVPIFFLPHGDASARLAQILSTAAGHRATDRVVLSVGKTVRTTEPTANVTLPSALIECSFVNKPKEARKRGPSLPHVLVTAHFDSLGVVPAAKTNGGASGAVAAQELWRRLTAAASQEEAEVPYAVTVLLGSTARFNYAGTTTWAARHSDAELDRFKVVVSLDELLPNPDAAKDASDLYLHIQDSLLKRSHGQQVVEQVESLAKTHGVSLKVVPAKTNYQHYDLRFEHEVFASRQMPAITLSTRRTHHVDQIYRDVRRPAFTADDAAALTKRVDFVEALVRMLASVQERALPAWPGSSSYVAGMLNFASISHRSPVANAGAGLKQYATAVEHQMRTQAAVAQRAAQSTATTAVTFLRLRYPGLTVFGPYEETMSVFLAKSVLVEGAIAAASAAALLAFLYVEFGVKGIKSLLFD